MNEQEYNNYRNALESTVGLGVGPNGEAYDVFEMQNIKWVYDRTFDEACAEHREKRNTLLSETDWWATSDRTMTTEQTAYRQALRDITDQAGFPTDITWPTKPE
jgi:hypothetical protein